MRPLPRLHAITDRHVLATDDFGIRAAAIAAAGPAVALHARDRDADGQTLTKVAARLLALAGPPEASVFVNGRPDIAAAVGAQGIQLGDGDLDTPDARAVLRKAGREAWIGRSVHSVDEAKAAVGDGADFLLVGTIYPSGSHPGRPGAGVALIRETAALGRPVIAIGGVTPARAAEAREAGAYGVAAIAALWNAPDPAVAALAMLRPWLDEPERVQ